MFGPNGVIAHLRDGKVFGAVRYYTLIIEFQKRGLPHAHMLIQLERGPKTARSAPCRLFAMRRPPQHFRHHMPVRRRSTTST